MHHEKCEDVFLLQLAMKSLADTVQRMPELEKDARNKDSSPFYSIGYLQSTIIGSLARLEDFVAANPELDK